MSIRNKLIIQGFLTAVSGSAFLVGAPPVEAAVKPEIRCLVNPQLFKEYRLQIQPCKPIIPAIVPPVPGSYSS